MASTITSLGVGSGLDLTKLLGDLRTAEESKLAPITTRQSSTQTKISAFGTLSTSLQKVQAAAKALTDASLFQGTSSSGEHPAFSIATGTKAAVGRYAVDVTQLAQANSIALGGVESKTATLGSGNLELSVGDQQVSIKLENATLESVRDAINSQQDASGKPLGMRAAIVNSGSGGFQLALTSRETGVKNAIGPLEFVPSGAGSAQLEGVFAAANRTQATSAQDAQFTLNGIKISQASNQVNGVVDGVDITLTAETDGKAQVFTVSQDTSKANSAVQGFVSAYNDYLKAAGALGKASPDNLASSGALNGNATLRSVQSGLRSALGADAQLGSLGTLGVTINVDGTLQIDAAALNTALTNNSSGVSKVLMGEDGGGGIIGRFSGALKGMLDDGNGAIKNATSGLQAQLTRLNQQKDSMSARIDTTMERYRKQFVSLDQMMSQMTNLSTQLTQQFDSLNKKD